jgi:tetratricopeptide (TPR) repeat protein
MSTEPEARSLEWAGERFQLGLGLLSRGGVFTSGDLELALSAFIDAGTVYSSDRDPERWARIMLELGRIYGLRREGSRASNLRVAIEYFTHALEVFRRETHPLEWAECHRGLGRALLKLCDGSDALMEQRALLHYESALQAVTRDNWPELWHLIHLELSVLYCRHSANGGGEELKLAREHYLTAFDFDRERRPGLYDSMMQLHLLYSELLRLRRGDPDAEQKKRSGTGGPKEGRS